MALKAIWVATEIIHLDEKNTFQLQYIQYYRGI